MFQVLALRVIPLINSFTRKLNCFLFLEALFILLNTLSICYFYIYQYSFKLKYQSYFTFLHNNNQFL